MFDPEVFRAEFPYFAQNSGYIYLDSAATTLKPRCLIEATAAFYCSAGSVHRSQYDQTQTALYEQARLQVKKLINAESESAIIWTSGTTQAINTVANGLLSHLKKDDEIIISQAEHHANFVSWQQIAQKCGAKLHILPLLDNWLIDQHLLVKLLNQKTKIVALNMISNVTGTKQPVEDCIKLIRQNSNALILLDVAQAINHIKIDLATLDADFIAFSAHKIYGPTGLGVLSGKLSALEKLQPLQYGGKMVEKVYAQTSQFSPLPYRLEAGTPNIAAVIGFNAVLTWLAKWNCYSAEQHCLKLAEQAKMRLQRYANCRLFNASQPSSIISFTFDNIAHSDLTTLLAEQKIAVRTGAHCAMPYLARLGVNSTLRLSFAPYNNQQDLDIFFTALDKALDLLEEI